MKRKNAFIILYSIIDSNNNILLDDIITRQSAEKWLIAFSEKFNGCRIHTYEKPYYIKVWKIAVACYGDKKKRILYNTDKDSLLLAAAAYPIRETIKYAGMYSFPKAQELVYFPHFQEM